MSTLAIYGNLPVQACSNIRTDLRALEALILTLTTVVSQAYPRITITAGGQHVANMSVTTSVSAPIYIRLIWKKQHPGTQFLATLSQCYQLEDTYLSFGITDWQSIDPLLVQQFDKNGIRF
jgi:hypothetical protein